MHPNAIEHTVTELITERIASPNGLSGCSELEIKEVESVCKVTLPSMYRQFLRQMGKSAGSFLVGADYQLPALITLRAQTDRLLRAAKSLLSLGSDDFVFAVHQGYQFLFFKTKISAEPAVFSVRRR